MNLQHLRAFFWLRWRIRVNQLRRGGLANAVILALLTALVVLVSLGLFVGFFLAGLLLLPQASPTAILFTWDGLILAFLFFWCIGLLAELQRSEALSLQKFLHLPVSLWGAFVVNYLTSLLSVNLALFVPAMLGLALGLVLGRGPIMLLLLPVLAACLLLVTALTHQFQSWLAALMSNPRRRRTVIVVATLVFVLLFQLPNLLNVVQPWNAGQDELAAWRDRELHALLDSLARHQITPGEYQRRREQLQQTYQARTVERGQQTLRRMEQTARLVNLVLPPCWLALGAGALAEGNGVPALLATLGLGLLGSASLWRSYRTTVRLYRGEVGLTRSSRPAAPARPVSADGRPRLVERQLPWVSEHAAAIALASLRSLLRAPEAKMILLSPIILVAVFGSLLLTRTVEPPEPLRPLMAYGGVATVLFTMIQVVGNQFGFDRAGFRVFVLCPASRRDILLGKNLAVAPLALGLAFVLVCVLQGFFPMRPDHFLALLPMMVSMYLVFCLLANVLSIFAPMAVAAGAFRPSSPKGLAILLHLGFLFLFPLALAPILLPLGVELLLEASGRAEGLPVCLALSVVECVAVVLLYRLALTWQGAWLAGREQKILEVVAGRAE